jgi:glycosyltransferase involved in cell wall biosynthesis
MPLVTKAITLENLPPPPLGKTGFPWTEQTDPLPDRMPDGSEYPRISIVTPSYNQGQFIEETIRSVLLQGYPNLEYIIIDGGSTDNTVEIIKRYEPWIAYWVSEGDRGQSHALNKGFRKSNGEILGWLNSDDYYNSMGLITLTELIQQNPNCVVWIGVCQEIDRKGKLLRKFLPQLGDKEEIGNWGVSAFSQPSCLFSRNAFFQVEGLDERLEYAMDVDLWLRLLGCGEFATVDKIVSYARIYPEIKTCRDRAMQTAEMIAINVNCGNSGVAKFKLVHYIDTIPLAKLLIYLIKRLIPKNLKMPLKKLLKVNYIYDF